MISAGRDFVLAAKITEGILSTLSKRVGGIISMLQKKKKKKHGRDYDHLYKNEQKGFVREGFSPFPTFDAYLDSYVKVRWE